MDFEYQTSSEFELREAIMDLYLNIKIRSSDEVTLNSLHILILDSQLLWWSNGGRAGTALQDRQFGGFGLHQAVSWDFDEHERRGVRLIHQEQRPPRQDEHETWEIAEWTWSARWVSATLSQWKKEWCEQIRPFIFHAEWLVNANEHWHWVKQEPNFETW